MFSRNLFQPSSIFQMPKEILGAITGTRFFFKLNGPEISNIIFKSIICKINIQYSSFCTRHDIAFRWMPKHLMYEKSTLVHITSCHAIIHYHVNTGSGNKASVNSRLGSKRILEWKRLHRIDYCHYYYYWNLVASDNYCPMSINQNSSSIPRSLELGRWKHRFILIYLKWYVLDAQLLRLPHLATETKTFSLVFIA